MRIINVNIAKHAIKYQETLLSHRMLRMQNDQQQVQYVEL